MSLKQAIEAFTQALGDVWPNREDIAALCPSCAIKMASLGWWAPIPSSHISGVSLARKMGEE